MLKVKVCGMRDLRNIADVAATGPDYLGFLFYTASKRYIGDSPDTTLFQQIDASIQKVGVFVDEKPEKVLELAGRCKLNLVQLHGSETPHECTVIRSAGMKVIKSFGVDSGFRFAALTPYLKSCDYFLFDTRSEQHGGTGKKFDWGKIRQYTFAVPFFLSGGIGVEDAAAIKQIRHPALHAIDINSRFEDAPGIKNAGLIRTFIKEIKSVIK
jgi:phosphoribosylanthranilate isomerase